MTLTEVADSLQQLTAMQVRNEASTNESRVGLFVVTVYQYHRGRHVIYHVFVFFFCPRQNSKTWMQVTRRQQSS